MFRIDLFAFGGGFASVPLMYNEIVDVRSWMDGQTFLNGIALGQITPGPIVITATFVGYMLYGLIGAGVATVSIFLPSFLIVIGVTPYIDRLRNSAYFAGAIRAILCSFVGLLLTVTFRFASNISWDIPRVLLAVAASVGGNCGFDVFALSDLPRCALGCCTMVVGHEFVHETDVQKKNEMLKTFDGSVPSTSLAHPSWFFHWRLRDSHRSRRRFRLGAGAASSLPR